MVRNAQTPGPQCTPPHSPSHLSSPGAPGFVTRGWLSNLLCQAVLPPPECVGYDSRSNQPAPPTTPSSPGSGATVDHFVAGTEVVTSRAPGPDVHILRFRGGQGPQGEYPPGSVGGGCVAARGGGGECGGGWGVGGGVGGARASSCFVCAQGGGGEPSAGACVHVCVRACVFCSDAILIHNFLHPLTGVTLLGSWHLSGLCPRGPSISATGLLSMCALQALLLQPTDPVAHIGAAQEVAAWALATLPTLVALGPVFDVRFCLRRWVGRCGGACATSSVAPPPTKCLLWRRWCVPHAGTGGWWAGGCNPGCCPIISRGRVTSCRSWGRSPS